MRFAPFFVLSLLVLAAACTAEMPVSPAAGPDAPAADALAMAKQDYPPAGASAGSLGKVTIGTNVSAWNLGSGQFNGQFITAESQGVVIGLRAQERFVGPLQVTGDRGNRVGVYEAATGTSDLAGRATWNYDFHVDLSNATGNARGKVLADYRLVLEQDYTTQSLFGALGFDPVELPLDAEPLIGVGVCSNSTFDASFLCQQSWNPKFGNTDFDPEEERTYNFRLVLTPKTFNSPPLAVAIQVVVSDE